MTAHDLTHIPPLSWGSHASPEDGMCIMEAAAFVAGEPFSDRPDCVCLVIGAFLRTWNDDLPDNERDALMRPLILRIIRTRSTKAVEARRSAMAADWLVREHAPTWLRLAGLTERADELSALSEFADMAQFSQATPALQAASKSAGAAWSAPWNPAWDEAGNAAWDAAAEAVMAAAGDAVGAAAMDALGGEAWDAAWAAVRHAAWAAAGDAARAAAMASVKDAVEAAAGYALGGASWDAAWDAVWTTSKDPTKYAIRDAVKAASWDAARDAARDALQETKATLQQSALRLVDRMIAVTEDVE